MKAVVIYDSVFGNTEKVAQAIGNVLGTAGEVGVYKVSEVKPEQLTGLDLLVAGSPTRGFRPTPATITCLKGIPTLGLKGVKVAAFDTRIAMEDSPGFLRLMIRLFGYAAKPISGHLVSKGGTLVAPPEGFIVKASEGPLKDGELERAGKWAEGLVKA